MARKRRQAIDSAYDTLIGGGEKASGARKPNPLGVSLEAAEIAELSAIAEELGIRRHQVLQYAVRKFLADWRQGKRPKLSTKTITTLELD